MSIRKRLILSYMAMVVVPIILFIVAGLSIMAFFLGDLKELRTLLPESHNYKQEVSADAELFAVLKEKSFTDPIGLIDPGYLLAIQTDLENTNADIIIRQAGTVVYASKEVSHIVADDLPDFGVHSSNNNIEKIGKDTYSIRQHDFQIPESGPATMFLIKDASILVKLSRTFIPLLFAVCLLILVITNGLLSYYVSRSIIKPINSLKNAAQKIKDGNLDHSIEAKGKDEITELALTFEAMREQLKESAEVKAQYEENRKELIAHISHDLKTPITSIKGYVEGIRDGVTTTPEMFNRYIQTIYQKSIDLDHLIEELFLYSKLDLKKVPFSFEIVDLKGYLVDFLEELSFDFDKINTKIEFSYDQSTSYRVKVDRDKIKRVFANIVNNSLKYMDKENGLIDIKLYSIGEQIFIKIVDNGPGIPNEALPFIFHQFFRAEQSRSKQTGGSGLGLSIARMIIEEHGGTIKVHSLPDEGTTIIISLTKYP